MDKEDIKKEIKERIKVIHTITNDVDDGYIEQLTSNAINEFKIITGAEEVKEVYLFVIEGVVDKRYIRRGAEGLTSDEFDTYKLENDFEEYLNILSVEYGIQMTGGRPARVVKFL